MSDYTEHLISQAGGDGGDYVLPGFTLEETELIILSVREALRRNRTTAERSALKLILNKLYDPATTPPAPRTEDWTVSELFGAQEGSETNYGTYVYSCFECGAVIDSRAKHLTWHNKLLP